MNETINLLLNHKSIRQFDLSHQISDTELALLLSAGRQASTWMNGQFYSIIVVKDEAQKDALQNLKSDMPFIKNSSVLLVFVADLNRTKVASEMHNKQYHATGMEPVLLGTVDASLAAQNVIIAAESLNLGAVIIGMIRPKSVKAAEILSLPDYTAPLFMLALGKPTEKAVATVKTKPRLPKEAVIHYNTYRKTTPDAIKQYDETLSAFAGNRKTSMWSGKFANYFTQDPQQDSTELMKKHRLISGKS